MHVEKYAKYVFLVKKTCIMCKICGICAEYDVRPYICMRIYVYIHTHTYSPNKALKDNSGGGMGPPG